MQGFFTQSVCLLTDGHPTIDDVTLALREAGYEIAKSVPAHENPWFSGPSVVVPFLPDVNGYVSVDVVDRPWPDTMGDPSSDPDIFGAWATSNFGPLAYPGGLASAQLHSWAWPQGRAIAATHAAFIRLRTSYVFGAHSGAPVVPNDHNPIDELTFLSRLAQPILSLSGVICYFNPNGEVLRNRATFLQSWNAAAEQNKLPLLLWSNIRYFDISDRFALIDTLGNSQFGVADIEAIFPTSEYDPGEVDYYLRNVTHYLLDSHAEIHAGEPIDGPGETNLSWLVDWKENGLVQPPRRVLGLYPRKHQTEIETAISAVQDSSE